jgi:hypothetical protein
MALQTQLVNEDLKYAMEIMGRDIKESYIMASSTDGKTIYLNHPTKNIDDANCTLGGVVGCLQYKFNSTDGRIEVEGKNDSDFVPLTSSKIIVESVNFIINATKDEIKDQPKITISIKAKAKNDPKNLSELLLQTTISQKEILNLYQGAL